MNKPLKKLIRSWVLFSVRRPWLVLGLCTLMAVLLGKEAVERFQLKSDLGDLLPSGRSSVSDLRWVKAHAGTSAVIEMIMRPHEPQPDRVAIVGDDTARSAQDIGQVRVVDGDRLVIAFEPSIIRGILGAHRR